MSYKNQIIKQIINGKYANPYAIVPWKKSNILRDNTKNMDQDIGGTFDLKEIIDPSKKNSAVDIIEKITEKINEQDTKIGNETSLQSPVHVSAKIINRTPKNKYIPKFVGKQNKTHNKNKLEKRISSLEKKISELEDYIAQISVELENLVQNQQ
ncbi:MAG: hypothetical protein Satyrvirus3_15 [Satyrvirus sp.]|uniref:Uncharacterized protein n=1 Tax=Satyrvirus sp. TaxID=2487771 RepID=A0A3G5AES0_9VIRU|nr:MAG: hypothetical protein Satyrvirus3_15 [Satyrvirus sp.]